MTFVVYALQCRCYKNDRVCFKELSVFVVWMIENHIKSLFVEDYFFVCLF